MKVPLKLPKDQVLIVVALGVITGFYNWRSLLLEHLKEEATKINEIYHNGYFVHSLVKKTTNALVGRFSAIGLLAISGALSFVCFKIFIVPWYQRWRYRKAEALASIIYEQRYGRASQKHQGQD